MTSALFSLGSCEEDVTDLGVNLPGTTPISTTYEDFAATPIQASTVLQTGLPTALKDHYIVGRLQDGNTRGQLEAKAFLQLTQLASPTSLGDLLPSKYAAQNPRLDSVVLFAGFDQVYGSARDNISISVYNLAQPLDERASYNSASTVPLGQPVRTAIPALINRVIRNKAGNQDSILLPLRLPLKKTGTESSPFVDDFFNNFLKTTTSERITDQQLESKWPGIALLPASSGTAIGFNRSPASKIVFYYRVTPTATDTMTRRTYNLYFNDPGTLGNASPRYFTNINYDLTGAGSPFGVLQGNSTAEVPFINSGGTTYAQEGTGLATKLVIPGLETLRIRQQTENLIINRAELIIPARPYSTGQFSAPAQLYLYELGSDNSVLTYLNGVTPTERAVQQDGYSVTTAGKEEPFVLRDTSATSKYYTGLMTSYVQAYAKNQLAGPLPAAFLLSPTLRRGGTLSLNRAALDASNIRLRVYYSKPAAR
ncbi:DUF4270 family protein [Hymenobacter sp. CRA2]|uniref:DUF4270 family protein n=1 Tax=Hymenobacter sp. CRA2 TaxID=1955620 RepID=UPI0009C698D6|nr:DUF4270 family protein [Hymenobacter sp. CRA2]OON70924.1 hypothetical protein B0919_02665 [Hymenobacter sp. CRA2]